MNIFNHSSILQTKTIDGTHYVYCKIGEVYMWYQLKAVELPNKCENNKD